MIPFYDLKVEKITLIHRNADGKIIETITVDKDGNEITEKS